MIPAFTAETIKLEITRLLPCVLVKLTTEVYILEVVMLFMIMVLATRLGTVVFVAFILEKETKGALTIVVKKVLPLLLGTFIVHALSVEVVTLD